MKKKFLPSALLVLLISCGQSHSPKKSLEVQGQGQASMLVVGVTDTQALYAQASKLNLKIEGDAVLRISGDISDINSLEVDHADKIEMMSDEPVEVSAPDKFSPNQMGYFQAKKDFGIVDFWKKRPEADGRGVVVGVFDDGISPNQAGFKVTTDGKRKFLKKGSLSSFGTFTLTAKEDGSFQTTIDETKKSFDGALDFNLDGKHDNWNATVSADGSKICLDLNNDKSFADDECKGSFSQTGDFFALPSNPIYTVLAEVDLKAQTLKIIPAEKGDGHGEGVASVMAGHKIGNVPGFDGVAPGAQIVDLDISSATDKAEESEYTIGTFITGLDWLGKNGAEVANVSYSLFFTSVRTQYFMQKALEAIVKKHNMVICFSAGNNGPGLGSLNRRVIYPHNVLVTAAYVSPELDENVWGVTGLPEEGRVVFYSSLGPGPTGIGPVVLSPLSSLTHASADTGFQSFNGTSSATPALAGTAAVLISALKQEGLKIDAMTVVHALRQSAKALKNEPFISQGYGIPQIEEAVSIYKKLINGERLLMVDSKIDVGAIEGVGAKGIVIKTSSAKKIETRKITLVGAISPIAPADAKVNLLLPVDVIYSEGITGPRENWVGAGSSGIYIDIDVAQALAGRPEAFGEIRLISKIDGSLVSIIPVTLIDDQNVVKGVQARLQVASQEGKRLHLNVPPGTQGFRVRVNEIQASNFLNVSVFNPSGVRIKNMKPKREFWVSTPVPGYYQIGLNMWGGSRAKGELEFIVEPINIRLLTNSSKASGAKLTVVNNNFTAISGSINMIANGKTLASEIFSNKSGSKIPELSVKVTKKGTYQVSINPIENSDINYFQGNCFSKSVSPDGKVESRSEASIKVEKDEKTQLTFRCSPFDWGADPDGKDNEVSWIVKVSEKGKTVSVGSILKEMASTSAGFPATAPGTYSVTFRDASSEEHITLGTVDLY